MRRLAIIAVVAVSSLFAAGCYPDLAHTSGVYRNAGRTAYVEVHEGGRLDDKCVLDVIVTAAGLATAVAVSIAVPPSAILIVAGWTLFGIEGAVTLNDCLASFYQNVQFDMADKGIIANCYVSGMSTADCGVALAVYEYWRPRVAWAVSAVMAGILIARTF